MNDGGAIFILYISVLKMNIFNNTKINNTAKVANYLRILNT